MRSQQFSKYGLLLIVALLGGCATDAPSAGNTTKLGDSERVGGQSGTKEHLEKGSAVSHSPEERIGGQGGGVEEPLERGTTISSDSGERVGGQSGQELPLEK